MREVHIKDICSHQVNHYLAVNNVLLDCYGILNYAWDDNISTN